MMTTLLVAHIAVLGYWLGSELVINSTYRLVCYADDMPFEHRSRLMDHVMNVDQHVRYALVLQVTLGTMLTASYGWIPGGSSVVTGAAVAGGAWLLFIEAVHRQRKQPVGVLLARIDHASRYLLMAAMVAIGFGLVGWALPSWLRFKLLAFVGVMACGVAIRFALITHFRVWSDMADGHITDANNALVKRTYVRATSILILLWILIGVITILSITKAT